MASHCIKCKKVKNLVPIFKRGTYCGDDEDFSDKHICESCLRKSDDYNMCAYCGEDGVYHTKDLKSDSFNNFCKEHYGETFSEDEQLEDEESFVEYVHDPSHWN
ncbi:hypothetical protein [Bacillus wiedmannii]|uniref:hypothetical protein n=1 Tax=Bacillus wiedmannii TaxID=1890302 RepID=UPI0021D0AF9E|nr:hypothetical protein [Bacillus wiedmannii]MCU5596213.1 hypothetical protein [Bacillus wiedmannii]